MENSLIEGLKDRITTAVGSYQSIGIVLPSSNYNDLTQALFDFIQLKSDQPIVYVTITKPYHLLSRQYQEIITNSSITFVDCVSRAAGIQVNEQNDKQCYYLDSPSQLEQLILIVVNKIKNHAEEQPIVILDALSTLSLYNDGLLVTEFFSHLLNNLNLYNTHTISLCLDEEMNDYMSKMLYLKNEKIIKLKESFI